MATYVYPPVVPPNQSAPFAVLTENDHRAWLFITASLGVAMTLLASAIRAFIKCGTKSGLGIDDMTLAISTIISLIQSSLVLAAGHNGLGSSTLVTSASSLAKAQKLYYASNLLYVFSLGASRQSVVFFLRRITPVRLHVRVLNVMLGAEIAWILVFSLAMALQCDLDHPWVLGKTCGVGWFARWEAIETTAAVFELMIFAVAIWTLVWNLQVATNKKAIIVVAFGLRLAILLIAIGFHLSSFDRRGFTSDPTLHEASFICWTQSEMNLSIIAASIPIAHKLLASLVTYYGGAGGRNLSQTQTAWSFPMGSLHSHSTAQKTNQSDNNKPEVDHDEIMMCGGREDVRYSVNIGRRESEAPIVANERRGNGLGMMIRKDVTYQVEYDN